MKKLPVSLTRSEAAWGLRYLLFELVFLASLIQIVLSFVWPGYRSVHLNLIYFLVNFFAVIGIFRHFLLENGRYTFKHMGRILLTAGIGFLVYEVLIWLVSVAIVLIFPNYFNVNDASISAVAQQDLTLMALGTVVLVPIVEETLFRGLVFGQLHGRSRLLAYTVSTLVFCAIHIMNYIGYYEPLHLLICFIQYIPAGLALAAAYETSGSIFAPTLIHMAVNAIGVMSMR